MAQSSDSDPNERTTISISKRLADELYDMKDRGESYEDVLWELIEESEE